MLMMLQFELLGQDPGQLTAGRLNASCERDDETVQLQQHTSVMKRALRRPAAALSPLTLPPSFPALASPVL